MAFDWFVSYLVNRVQLQYVNIDGFDSIFLHVKCGVPQGSILGTLLFIIYINHIVYSFKLATFIMFADDTNIFFKHKNRNTLYDTISSELTPIANWFKLNKLSLSPLDVELT